MDSSNRQIILVVEDEQSQRDILESYLSDKYSLRFAKNGEEAVSFFKHYVEIIDLILLDINLPDMSGYQVHKKFREVTKTGIPNIVMVTAYDTHQDWIRTLTELQSFYHLGKPFSKESLLSVVEQALHNATLVRKQGQTKLRITLNDILIRRNSWALSERVTLCINEGRTITPDEANETVIHFETIHEHPKGLGYLVEILEKDSGEKALAPSQPNILLVEDEDSICAMTQVFFESKNLPIFVAKTVHEAKEILSKTPNVDLIFLDLNLPDGHGVSILDSLFAEWSPKNNPIFELLDKPDVVVASAYMDKETITECMHGGAIAYMTKPIPLDKMWDATQKLCKRRYHLQAIQLLWMKMMQQEL